MEDRKEGMNGGGWMSVPAFGDWDKNQGIPDYSMDFSKIRENRKIHKSDFSRASLGNEEELVSTTTNNDGQHRRGSSDQRGVHRDPVADDHHRPHHIIHHDHSPTTRKSIKSYFQCCIGA